MKIIFLVFISIINFVFCDENEENLYKIYWNSQQSSPNLESKTQGLEQLFRDGFPIPAVSPVGLTSMFISSNNTCSSNSVLRSVDFEDTYRYPFQCNGMSSFILPLKMNAFMDGYQQVMNVPRLFQNNMFMNGNFIQMSSGLITSPTKCAGSILFELTIYLANNQYQCAFDGVNGHKIIYQLKLITGECQSTCWLQSGGTLLNPPVNNLGFVEQQESANNHQDISQGQLPVIENEQIEPVQITPVQVEIINNNSSSWQTVPVGPDLDSIPQNRPQQKIPPSPVMQYPVISSQDSVYNESPFPQKPVQERPTSSEGTHPRPVKQSSKPYPENTQQGKPYPQKSHESQAYPDISHEKSPYHNRPEHGEPVPQKPYPDQIKHQPNQQAIKPEHPRTYPVISHPDATREFNDNYHDETDDDLSIHSLPQNFPDASFSG